MNLQDSFLNQARQEAVTLTVYLINGFQFKGKVLGFDNFTLILGADGKQYLIYKHAISTLIPARPLSITSENQVKEDRISANREKLELLTEEKVKK